MRRQHHTPRPTPASVAMNATTLACHCFCQPESLRTKGIKALVA